MLFEGYDLVHWTGSGLDWYLWAEEERAVVE